MYEVQPSKPKGLTKRVEEELPKETVEKLVQLMTKLQKEVK